LKINQNMKRLGLLLRHNLNLGLGLSILVPLLIMGFVVSLFAPYDPRRWNIVPRNLPPSLNHPFGTTHLGQDIFWLMTYAIRNTVILGCVSSTVVLVVGIALGLIAGYKGGLVEKIILFFADTFIILPGLPMLILIASLIKTHLDMVTLGLIIASITWGGPVRNIRSMILSLRERDFTYVAIFSGYSTAKIVFREYLPHVLPWILSAFIARIIFTTGMEVTLAIFGLSTLQEATLGTMIYWANFHQALIRGLWWWIGSPIIFLVIYFVSLFLISVGINEYVNPRIRTARMKVG